MKKLYLLVLSSLMALSLFAQDDEYKKYLESMKQAQSEFMQDYNDRAQKINEEYVDFKAKANAEFADFVAKEWALFEEFKVQELSMTLPKLKEAPETSASGLTEIESDDVKYKEMEELPSVMKIESVNSVSGYVPRNNNYVLKKTVTSSGVKEVATVADTESFVRHDINEGRNVSVNFYGKKLFFDVDDALRVKHNGNKESDVADYFKKMAKLSEETANLWRQIDEYVNQMGLNEWGYFCILRTLSEEILADVDNRVLFNFYMLRNEGGFKVKTARGKDSNKLTLLAAIDNSKEVYSYSFFRFKESDGKNLKYYTIYGGGRAKESIYTYDYCEQEKDMKQIGLDFNNTLNMGSCDMVRELSFNKINSSIELPYNSAHVAYMDDIPMTIFPIYFASPIAIEAQQIFNAKLNELKQQYTPVQFIDIILNFVQTAFDYKTDDQQFGYEKYFYPEEVIAYPYSDCEDRSALFAWLVTTYTDAKVVGLQYEGHLATAVCFGDDTNVFGDMFSYGGKKYYVCDPTYINASIGMTMPQFKDMMPKIIKM